MKYTLNLRALGSLAISLGVCSIFGSLACLPAAAETVVQDQFFPGSNNALGEVSPNLELAQTFPVTLDGFLTSLDIWVNQGSANPLADLYWDVRPTAGGAPVAANALAFASGTIPNEDIPVFPELLPTRIDLSGSGIRVEPGDLLAITLHTNEGIVGWRVSLDGNPADTFLRNFSGQSWTSITLPDRSLGLSSYVLLVPEPSSVALLSLEYIVAFAVSRRR